MRRVYHSDARNYYNLAFQTPDGKLHNSPFWLIFVGERIYVRTLAFRPLATVSPGTPVVASHLRSADIETHGVLHVRLEGQLRPVSDVQLHKQLFEYFPDYIRTAFQNAGAANGWAPGGNYSFEDISEQLQADPAADVLPSGFRVFELELSAARVGLWVSAPEVARIIHYYLDDKRCWARGVWHPYTNMALED